MLMTSILMVRKKILMVRKKILTIRIFVTSIRMAETYFTTTLRMVPSVMRTRRTPLRLSCTLRPFRS